MQIQIQAPDLEPGDPLFSHVERRLRYALSRSDARVSRVWVRLTDLNRPKGGMDKACRIEVRLAGLPSVVIEDIQPDVYTAVDRAADRAGRTVMRRLGLPRARGRAAAEPRIGLHSR
jgi:ribosome-associated translation inhibitor RaiA